jgi:hypothetical protein
MKQQRKYLAMLNIPGGPKEQFFTEDESILLDWICGFPQDANAQRTELYTAGEPSYEWLENEGHPFN